MGETDRNTMAVLRSSRILAYSVGALSLIAGVVLLFWPDRTWTVVARLVGVLFIVVGFGQTVEAISSHRDERYWWFLLLRGLVNLGMGIALVVWPSITLTAVIWLVGLNLAITGVLGLAAAFQMPKEPLRKAVLLQSLVTLALGILIMVWPSATLGVISIIVAVVLIAVGATLIWSGVQLASASTTAQR